MATSGVIRETPAVSSCVRASLVRVWEAPHDILFKLGIQVLVARVHPAFGEGLNLSVAAKNTVGFAGTRDGTGGHLDGGMVLFFMLRCHHRGPESATT